MSSAWVIEMGGGDEDTAAGAEVVAAGAGVAGKAWGGFLSWSRCRFRAPKGPDSCPPQDVVVVSAPSPSGPQDVVELQQSNSTRVNDSEESGLTWEFRAVGCAATRASGRAGHADPALGAALPTENAQNVAPPSVARAAALHPGGTVRLMPVGWKRNNPVYLRWISGGQPVDDAVVIHSCPQIGSRSVSSTPNVAMWINSFPLPSPTWTLWNSSSPTIGRLLRSGPGFW